MCRVALLMKSGRLTSDVKLLTWGQPYEYQVGGWVVGWVSEWRLWRLGGEKPWCQQPLVARSCGLAGPRL